MGLMARQITRQFDQGGLVDAALELDHDFERHPVLVPAPRIELRVVGCAQVQVAVLTARIQQLTDHLKTNKKDFSSRRGLLKMVGRRRRLLNYLRSGDFQSYTDLISRLGLRK